MSNVEADPVEITCGAGPRDEIEVIEPRLVPLGGIRAMRVRRTLPTRDRSMIGAWCFADHYGPEAVADSGGMQVLPHPHTGLATVSWLFTGEIEHRDSAGVHALVRPGEMNLMSAGHGISHSEISTDRADILHGLQLWFAFPDETRDEPHGFQHYIPPAVPVTDATGATTGEMKVFAGTLGGSTADIRTATGLLGAEITIAPGQTARLEVDETFEHGVLVDSEHVEVEGARVERASLAYLGVGRDHLTIRNTLDRPARVVLLGGEPFGEDIVMWWNFIGRDHDEIVAFRDAWQERADRFGSVNGWADDQWIPAPALPNTRLTPRRRR